MNHQSENNLFRLFVVGWMSLTGVVLFLFMGLDFLGLSHDTIGNLMCFIPIILLSVLIYSYVKGRDVLLKRLCYVYIGIGIPCILAMFIVPILLQ